MEGDENKNEPAEEKPIETMDADKPVSVTRTSGSTGWLSLPYIFQLAALVMIIGCVYQVYKEFVTLDRRLHDIQEKQEKSEKKITAFEKDNIELSAKLASLLKENQNLEVKQEKSEKKIMSLEKDNIELNAKLTALSEEKQNLTLKLEKSERKILALEKDAIELKTSLISESEITRTGLNDINVFVKEFYKNFTVTHTLTNDCNATIHYLYNVTNDMNKTLRIVKAEQQQMVSSINQRFDATQGCQAGYDVGVDSTPAHNFPLARTVHFSPPFNDVPALSFGTTMLDINLYLRLRLELISLTTEYFTVRFHTWGTNKHGAKFSWMACPK